MPDPKLFRELIFEEPERFVAFSRIPLVLETTRLGEALQRATDYESSGFVIRAGIEVFKLIITETLIPDALATVETQVQEIAGDVPRLGVVSWDAPVEPPRGALARDFRVILGRDREPIGLFGSNRGVVLLSQPPSIYVCGSGCIEGPPPRLCDPHNRPLRPMRSA